MNPESNRFEPLTEELKVTIQPSLLRPAKLLRADGSEVPPHWTVLTVGEQIAVKGYTFKVAYINETTLVLEPVKIPILGSASPK